MRASFGEREPRYLVPRAPHRHRTHRARERRRGGPWGRLFPYPLPGTSVRALPSFGARVLGYLSRDRSPNRCGHRAVPAQQVEPFFPWLMRETGATTFYMPSADYIWPQTLNKKVREVVTAQGGEIVGEEYFPLDHVNYESVVADIMATGADVVFNTIVPPGLTHFLAQLHDAGFTARGGQVVCTYFDENFLNLVPAEHVEGLYGCLDYYRACRIRSASSSSTDTRPGTRAARCSRLARRAPAPTGH